jgi:hypothetical protein
MRPPFATSPSLVAPGDPSGARHARRQAAERNASRLSALAEATAPGLVVAAIAGDGLGVDRALPPELAAAVALAALPGVVVWAWPATATPEEIGRDLAAARASSGDDTRAVIVLRRNARVLSSPFPGEVGAEVEGVDAVPLVHAVGSLEEGELVRGVDVPWSDEAELLVSGAGFVARAPRG